MAGGAAKTKLDSFIDYNAPELCTVLHSTWGKQKKAITYKEIKDAIHAGQLDMKYLLQWQQDYSKFINAAYAPVAQKAIDAAAQALKAQYGVGFNDPAIGAMDSFIQTHGGKLIKQLSTEQFNAINTLVRQAALSDTMTVDDLARAIRPCVGLTQRQAQSVKNYYDAAIKEGYTPKQARSMQEQYAERVHRRRAYTIAETELAYAYNAGQDQVIRDAINDGTIQQGVEKEWSTAFDENVCDECGPMDGETVPIDQPFSNGLMLPPRHPSCRCGCKYHHVIPVIPAASQAAPAASQAPADPDYIEPEVPDSLKYDASDFTYTGSHKMGSGEMHQYEDATGQEWIFKPAQQKYGGHTPEPFRAYAQEAGYKVQYIVDPESSVPVATIQLDTPNGQKFGAIQMRMENLDSSFDLKAWQAGKGPMPSPEVLQQLQREHVTDWLMCNYDTHGGNFLLTNDGTLIGVDKEQAFRYIGKWDAQSMSYSFHPNSYIGETEPIYNTMYRKFAHGELDLSLNDTVAFIKRVEAIPDSEYREIFREYAEALHGKGAQAEQLLDQIVGRKQNLRSTFETFYGELLTERKGVPTTFQFTDAVVQAAAQSIQTSTMSSGVLSTMSLGDLQKLAKQQGIKYAWNMNKGQLVTAISDPSQTAQIVQEAKDRAYGIGTTPRTPKAPTAPAPAAGAVTMNKVDGITRMEDAMRDFDAALAVDNAGPRGVTLISDSGALEGLQTNLRKVDIDGQTCYELTGKMTNSRWLQAESDIRAASGGVNQWTVNAATGYVDYTQPTFQFTTTGAQVYSVPTRTITIGNDTLTIMGSGCDSSARAVMGQFQLRIYATDGQDAARRAEALLQKAKMMDITQPVDKASIDRMKKMRLIWQNDPKAATKLNPMTVTDAEIEQHLKRLGITQARVNAVKVKRVNDSFFTFYDPENVKIAKKEGVAYVWAGLTDTTGAVATIQSGEMVSSLDRKLRGILSGGASPGDDLESGGADSVFTRIALKQNVGMESYSDSFSNGPYRFLFKPEVLGRTDWYAFSGDSYGKTYGDFETRNGVQEHFQDLQRWYKSSNECMFRHALGLEDLKEIRCKTDYDRFKLIDRLNQQGITQINGQPLAKIIKFTKGKL
ncbi:MAG: hypothetical protein IJ089_07105 [Clostridia bacterium]|nr:hypothetical protein [Clostridia bacterium]